MFRPARSIALLESPDGVICTNKSYQAFERLLKVMTPDLQAVDALARLFHIAAPGNMCLVVSESSYGWLPKYADLCHEPRWVDERLECFFSDTSSGRFLRVKISKSYDLEVEDIGPGKKVWRK